MISSLNDLSMIQNHDSVTVSDSGKSVSDHEYRASFHQVIHTLLHDLFRTGIDTGSRFVQDQYRRIRHSRSGNREKLSLTL